MCTRNCLLKRGTSRMTTINSQNRKLTVKVSLYQGVARNFASWGSRRKIPIAPEYHPNIDTIYLYIQMPRLHNALWGK